MQTDAMTPLVQHNRQRSRVMTLGILLFLVGQLFSVAHASEFGSDPHDHNGVVCSAILTDEPDSLIPQSTQTNAAFVVLAFATLDTKAVEPARQTGTTRPPATGPPSI